MLFPTLPVAEEAYLSWASSNPEPSRRTSSGPSSGTAPNTDHRQLRRPLPSNSWEVFRGVHDAVRQRPGRAEPGRQDGGPRL
jgi:hypothetical protein